MDGWESRRRRTPGHDWCVVKLGMRGAIRGFNVNTAFFTGNYPTHCSIEALDTQQNSDADAGRARGGALGRDRPQAASCSGDSDNLFRLKDDRPWTHLRLNIFPDGGVARLRVYGDVVVDWKRVARPGKLVDLAAIQNGGLVLAASDMHYGAKDSIIMPGRATNMGDGWETKRRRGPGYDWLILRLGVPGRVARIELDTNHFKGNYPDRASIEGCLAYAETLIDLGLGRLERDPAADEAEAPPPSLLPEGTPGRRRRVARAPEHLSGRRRQPAAHLWNGGSGLTRRRQTRPAPNSRSAAARAGGSIEWSARRPFASRDAACAAAREEWFALGPADWLEAFAHHPRIGETRSAEASEAISAREQAGVTSAGDDVKQALAGGIANTRSTSGTSISCARQGNPPRAAGDPARAVAERSGNGDPCGRRRAREDL